MTPGKFTPLPIVSIAQRLRPWLHRLLTPRPGDLGCHALAAFAAAFSACL